MKRLALTCLLPALCHADSIKMADGSTMEGTVSRVVPTQVEILMPNGKILIPLSRLAEEEQKKLSPDLINEARIKTLESLVEKQRQLIDTLQPKPALSPEKQKSGEINLVKIGASLVKNSERYAYVAWKVEISNSMSESVSLNVSFRFMDAQEFELKKEVEYGVLIPAGGSKTVTGQSMIEIPVWNRVKSYKASTSLR